MNYSSLTEMYFLSGAFLFFTPPADRKRSIIGGTDYENSNRTSVKSEKIAATGKYNVLPVSMEMLSDFTTPIETMKILKNVSTHCYMLESAQANETWGRYTFLGFDPKLEVTCAGGEMRAGNLKVKTDNPSGYLRQILDDYKSPRFDYLPSFTGGLVGYFFI